jgi:hypothetical protein
MTELRGAQDGEGRGVNRYETPTHIAIRPHVRQCLPVPTMASSGSGHQAEQLFRLMPSSERQGHADAVGCLR